MQVGQWLTMQWFAWLTNRCSSLYCSSLYCDLPQVQLQPLDGVLRAAAKMTGGVPRNGHISDYIRHTPLATLRLARIHYRISTVRRYVLGNAPTRLVSFCTCSVCVRMC